MPPFLIDGHNLIGRLPDVDLGQPDDEAQLLQRLHAYRVRNGYPQLVVFFDSGMLPGTGSTPPAYGMEVHFAPPHLKADDEIVAYLRAQPEPGQFTVVTSDRELAARSRALGANVKPADDFARSLANPRRPAARPREEPGPQPLQPVYADLYATFLAQDDIRRKLAQGPQLTWDKAVEALYGGESQAAQRSARWLGLYGGPSALQPLRDGLTHADPFVRAAVLLAFADLNDPRALPDVSARLRDDPATLVRSAAAETLARIGDSDCLAVLQAAAETDPKPAVRRACRTALVQVRARLGTRSS